MYATMPGQVVIDEDDMHSSAVLIGRLSYHIFGNREYLIVYRRRPSES